MYTFPAYALQTLKPKRLSERRIPAYAIITDFDLHRRWVHPGIDRYYVATEDLRRELRQLGIGQHRINVSGIPLKQGFRANRATAELYARYGLDPMRRTVLIMAGAHGVLPHVKRICSSLLCDPNVQIILVCGNNRLLMTTATRCFSNHPDGSRLRVFGFVEQIHELMSLTDCLITKPGGITLAEAIAAELPAFIYRPVPGQEKQNALYLAAKGVAFIASDANTLTRQLLLLINDAERLADCRMKMKELQATSDARTAAQNIVLDISSNLYIMNNTSTF